MISTTKTENNRHRPIGVKMIMGAGALIGGFLFILILVFGIAPQTQNKPITAPTLADTQIPLTIVFSTSSGEINTGSQRTTGDLSGGVTSTSIPETIQEAEGQASTGVSDISEDILAATPIPTMDSNTVFILPALDGTMVSFPDHYGTVTVFLAGAAGCPTCAIEGSYLSKLQAEFGSQGLKVFVVDISPYDTPEFLQDWVEMVGQENLTWVFDEGRRFSDRFDVFLLDTTIILDANRQQVFRDEVVSSEATLRSAIEQAFTNS